MPLCELRHRGGCRGPLEWHHLVKQQRIRAAHRTAARAERDGGPRAWSLDRALGDPRNRAWLCQDHHEAVTRGRVHLPVMQRTALREFAKAYKLEWSLEKDTVRAVPVGRGTGGASDNRIFRSSGSVEQRPPGVAPSGEAA